MLGEIVAWVLDAYPEERERHASALRQLGVLLVGEFPTEREAFAAAYAGLDGGANTVTTRADHPRSLAGRDTGPRPGTLTASRLRATTTLSAAELAAVPTPDGKPRITLEEEQ